MREQSLVKNCIIPNNQDRHSSQNCNKCGITSNLKIWVIFRRSFQSMKQILKIKISMNNFWNFQRSATLKQPELMSGGTIKLWWTTQILWYLRILKFSLIMKAMNKTLKKLHKWFITNQLNSQTHKISKKYIRPSSDRWSTEELESPRIRLPLEM